jgi:hypothetical protein
MSWDDYRAEIAIGLTGVTAAERYAWGISVNGEIVFDYESADEQSRIDFNTARSLADEIDPQNEYRVMADAWGMATELVADGDVWEAIEWLAGIIEGVELDGVAVSRIVQGDDAPKSIGGQHARHIE